MMLAHVWLSLVLASNASNRDHVTGVLSLCAVLRRGLHFLVVQKDEDAEECAGLWLMQNREMPTV